MNEFTKDELLSAAYALRELSSRRREQAIDWKMPHIDAEADTLWNLSAKFQRAAAEKKAASAAAVQ